MRLALLARSFPLPPRRPYISPNRGGPAFTRRKPKVRDLSAFGRSRFPERVKGEATTSVGKVQIRLYAVSLRGCQETREKLAQFPRKEYFNIYPKARAGRNNLCRSIVSTGEQKIVGPTAAINNGSRFRWNIRTLGNLTF